MKKTLLFSSILVAVLSVWAFFGGRLWYIENIGYKTYAHVKHSVRMEPDLVVNGKTAQILSMGYENMYADTLWISLMQYIGDNLAGNAYLSFLTNIEKTIITLNPDFKKMYEWGLLLLPVPTDLNLAYSDDEKKSAEEPLRIAEDGMRRFCNQEKLENIKHTEISNALWENDSLRNPCTSPMLPYYIAFYGWTLSGDQTVAHEYYKIAWMHDDVPSASRILAILASAPKDDPRSIAMNFTLMALGGQDSEPYMCHTLAETVFTELNNENYREKSVIQSIMNDEEKLVPPTKSDNINSCYSMLERGIKYTYLAFIADNTAHLNHILTAEDLIKHNIVDELPIPQMQSGTTLKKMNGNWRYAPQ